MAHNVSEKLGHFDLDGDSRDDLIEAGKLLGKYLDEVLDQFYLFATNDREIAAFFKSEDLIAHARSRQKSHWEMLISGEFSDRYFESANTIGRVHFRIQLPFQFYLAGYARATSHIQSILTTKSRGFLRPYGKRYLANMLGALTRAFALDTQLVIEAYFAAQQEEQNTAFRHLTAGIDRLAKRDLKTSIPSPEVSDFPQRYDNVRESFNLALVSINEVIETIQVSVGGLKQNATEVAHAAHDLSRRTETQAATLEETAAAMEEITVSIKSASETTRQSNSVISETRQNAEKSGAVVLEAVKKMQEIESSSTQISQIIGVIDDIAFQTNLLALNAGVEAARAGESGRGFAVVASEVRALAQRASDSAKEIKELITISSGHVKSGVSLVAEAGNALTKIVNDIGSAAELSADIALSSSEQSTGLAEINIGIAQLDGVTQQNAAMVEQATAAIESMQNETQTLSDLILSFEVGTTPPQALPDITSMRLDDWQFGSNQRHAGE